MINHVTTFRPSAAILISHSWILSAWSADMSASLVSTFLEFLLSPLHSCSLCAVIIFWIRQRSIFKQKRHLCLRMNAIKILYEPCSRSLSLGKYVLALHGMNFTDMLKYKTSTFHSSGTDIHVLASAVTTYYSCISNSHSSLSYAPTTGSPP